LDQAEDLVRKEKKKPKQASVRRAISAAYYALFHLFSEKVTETLIGSTNDRANIRAWLGRALEHGTMNTACKFFGNPSDRTFKEFSKNLAFTVDPDLKVIADTFVNLQESRHRADYDMSKPITRSDAQVAIAEVRSVFTKWNVIERKDPRLMVIFCTSLLRGTKRS
jgi:uncharacterized protein (UPF0332 family)